MLRALLMTFYLLCISVFFIHNLYFYFSGGNRWALLFYCYLLRVAAIGGAYDIDGGYRDIALDGLAGQDGE